MITIRKTTWPYLSFIYSNISRILNNPLMPRIAFIQLSQRILNNPFTYVVHRIVLKQEKHMFRWTSMGHSSWTEHGPQLYSRVVNTTHYIYYTNNLSGAGLPHECVTGIVLLHSAFIFNIAWAHTTSLSLKLNHTCLTLGPSLQTTFPNSRNS